MKYPRITYAEFLNIISQGVYASSVFRQIYPHMKGVSTDVGDQVDEVLEALGYVPVSTPLPDCASFEKDYLKRCASKVISPDVAMGLLLPNNLSIIARGYVTYDELVTAINYKAPDCLYEAVTEFMARSWDNIYKIFKAYTSDYNPIHNYSMTEDTDYTPLAKQTVKSSNKSKTDTTTDVGVFGFNSTVAVPSSSTDSGTTQLKADNEMETETSYDGKADNTHTEREGNIGVTTTQRLLTQELELRKLEILELIFQGLDEVICQSVYD